MLIAMPFMAGAQTTSDVKMVISGAGGNMGSLPLTTGTTLSFSGENLVVTQNDTSKEFKLADIDNIAFSAQVSAAEDVTVDLQSLKVNLSGGVLTASAAEATPIAYRVYSVNGAAVMAGEGSGAVTVDLNPLAKGVYIIKINDKVIKFNR